MHVPGTGPMVKAVEVASQRDAVICGKPDPYVMKAIMKFFPEVNSSRTAIVGDRYVQIIS